MPPKLLLKDFHRWLSQYRSIRHAASENGLSFGYLAKLKRGEEKMTPNIAALFGWHKIVKWEKKK